MRDIVSPLSGIRSPFGERRGISPSVLFALAEPGVWLDPSDTANLSWRRNLLTFTEQFDNAAWVKTRASITANAGVAPDGTTTADKMVESTDTGDHFIQRAAVTVSTATTYTLSYYAKAAERTVLAIFITGVTATGITSFNLSNGTIIATSNNTVSDISSVGSGWYRCSVTVTTNSTSFSPYIYPNTGGTSYTGDGTSGILIWGAQLEVGSTATAYQRITDVNTETVALFPNATLYQDTAGTTPVTTPGQSVALALDKSRGLVPGAELWANQTPTIFDFSGTVGAYNTLTRTMSNTGATFGGYPRFQFNLGLVSGRTYLVSGTLSGSLTQIAQIRLASSGLSNDIPYNSTTGVFFGRVVAAAASLEFVTSLSGANAVSISNISVRELPGNHATQATAGSRPLYALLPANGVRNLANGSADVGGTTFWPAAPVNNGITATKVASGIDVDGLPYVDVRYQGTATGTFHSDVYSGSGTFLFAVPGQQWTCSATFSRIGGSIANVSGIRTVVVEWTAPATYVAQTDSAFVTATTETAASASRTIATGDRASAVVQLVFTNGAAIDVTYRIKALQFELGSTRTAYQFNYARTNISQPPFAQVGALLFDGVDDFLQTPSVDFASATSDGQARRNVLNFPTLFDDVAWQKQNSTISANSAVAPDGTSTADKLQETAVTAAFSLGIAPTMSFSTTYTFSVYMKAAERSFGVLNIFTGAASCWTWYDLASGTVGTVGAGATASISSVGNGWYRCVLTIATAASGSPNVAMWPSTANNTLTYAGTAGSGILVWGAQLEIGSTASAFQNIGTDKMTVFAGVRKLSDAATAILVEAGADSSVNNGTFGIIAPSAAGVNSYRWTARGTIVLTSGNGAFAPAPDSAVLSATADISGDTTSFRRNNAVVQAYSADFGTGNFANSILYIGRRTGTTFPFSGYLYSLIVRGAATSADLITLTERWVNSRTGAY